VVRKSFLLSDETKATDAEEEISKDGCTVVVVEEEGRRGVYYLPRIYHRRLSGCGRSHTIKEGIRRNQRLSSPKHLDSRRAQQAFGLGQ
jgi:hypothetical protein